MNQQLESQFKGFEQKRKEMFAHLRTLEATKLHQQPADKWSVIQNINHLILSEIGTLTYLKKKIQAADTLKETGFANWFSYQLIYLYTILPIKIKAPKGLDSPSNEESLEIVEAKWDKVRANWQEFITQIPENQLELGIFKHPLVKARFNIYQTIDFCEAHFDRHRKQIKNTLR